MMSILHAHKAGAGRRGFTLLQALVVLGVFGLLAVLLLPVVRTAGPAARRTQCLSNLRQIALALHNYESDYHVLPPAYTVDEYGMPLHSWRTLILPYLDQRILYHTIDLSKAWDDPANAAACNAPVSVYLCPDGKRPENHTTYLASVGPNGCFLPTQGRQRSDITDDPSETLLIIEVLPDQSVPWMSPNDADEAFITKIGAESKLAHSGGILIALADGRIRTLSAKTPAAIRRALISIAGGETVGDF